MIGTTSTATRRSRAAAPASSSQLLTSLVGCVLVFLLFAALVVLLAGPQGAEPNLWLLHVGGAGSLVLFWRLLPRGGRQYDAFGPAMLLIGAMLKIQAAFDALAYGLRLDRIPYTVPLPDNLALLLAKSEALSVIGTLLLVTTWCVTIGKNVEEYSFLKSYRHIRRNTAALMYLAAIVIELLRRVADVQFGVISQLSSMTFTFGVASIFFIAAPAGHRTVRCLTAAMLGAPLCFLALGGGMKEAIFFPFVPAAVLLWFDYKALWLRATMILVALVLLAYSQLYIQYVRHNFWFTNAEASTLELLAGFEAQLKDSDFAQGLNSISARMNMTQSRAITVAIADARGSEPQNIFGPIPASFVPRILWPEKPVLQPGAQHTLRIRGASADQLSSRDLTEVSTATAAGFFTELYLGGSYIGWLLGAMGYGYLMARTQLFTRKHLYGLGHLSLAFIAAYYALRFEENHVAYTFTGLGILFVFLLLMRLTAILRRGSKYAAGA